eukprot:TRINITY_DN17876_c0_g1_i1.p1 TRINITY_DN17876_c0_g1~~TRINITY_DN17876_c0_g1_i1.p1  ORF type:complete len:1075 (-),score=179.60 TRINITY_DN17876_c0_g1_i1:198-3362(-)
MPVTAKQVKIVLTKGYQRAYKNGRPQPWQEQAICEIAQNWEGSTTRLIDHPRGSGKTREIVMMSHVALRLLGVRLVLLISDRKDLDEQLFEAAKDFMEKNGYPEGTVRSCSKGQQVEKVIRELEEDHDAKAVVAVTLQSFPHVSQLLSPELRDATAALADEAHRSHADKSLSEELNRVLGGPVHFLLYTGTASDRCLRLFGERQQRGDEIELCKPFHSVTEADVATKGMIFELGSLRRRCMELAVDMKEVEALVKKFDLDKQLLHSIKHRASTSRVEQVMMVKAAYAMKEFEALRKETQGSFRPQMMIVASSRRAVMDYVEACKAHVANMDEQVLIYGAFSGTLAMATAGADCQDGLEVDETAYNRDSFKHIEDNAPHRHADILVVCDRFETGYDNNCICLVVVDKRVTSPEKLVQIYSRGNRKRPGKKAPLVIDLQNPSKDVEHAVLEYTMPRECLANETGEVVLALSRQVSDILGDLVDKPKDEIEAAFASWTSEARSKLGGLLVPYLRRRKEGVGRAVAASALPVKQAELAWKVLSEKHKCDVAPIAEQMRAIADLALSRSCTLSTASFVESSGEMIQTTPQKRSFNRMNGTFDDEETPAKMARPSMEDLGTLLAEMRDIASVGDAGAQAPLSTNLVLDVQTLKRTKGFGRKRTFQCLQRVAHAAQDPEHREVLINLGVVDALVLLFINGDRIEQPWAWKAIENLACASDRASVLVTARKHIVALNESSVLREVELNTLKSLVTSMRSWLESHKASADVTSEIKAKREELTILKKTKHSLNDCLVDSDDSDDDFMSSLWHFRAIPKTKKEKKERAKSKREDAKATLQQRREEQQTKVNSLKVELQQLEAKQAAAASNDHPAAMVLGLSKAMHHLPDLCRGKLRTKGRKAAFEAWELMAALDTDWASMQLVVECLRTIDTARRSTSRPRCEAALRSIVGSLSCFGRTDLDMLVKMAAVDDLLAITGSQQVNIVAIECLRTFASFVPRARERTDLYDQLYQSYVSDELEDESVDQPESDVIADVLKQLRQQVARPKRARKSIAVDETQTATVS